MPRKDGGRGLISVEDCVNQAKISLDIARMLCPNKRGRTVKSRQEGWG